MDPNLDLVEKEAGNVRTSTPSDAVQTPKHSRGQAEPERNVYGPEASLGDVNCKKNPDHAGFFPAWKFDLNDLPEEHRTKEILHCIQARIPLTVHLCVGYVSKSRPQFYPDTTVPYPFYDFGGRFLYRTGSGFVSMVTKCGEGCEKDEDQICLCPECRENPKKSWWVVELRTAAHVAFDQSEVESTKVRFFYDEKSSDLHVYKGHECLTSFADGDWCAFTVIIHDEDVGKRLEEAWKHDADLELKHRAYFGSTKFDDLVVVISHPHGLSKHVTIGTRVRGTIPSVQHSLYYRTATCPGSSGGAVLWNWCRGLPSFWDEWHPHSEAYPDGVNRSGCVDDTFNLKVRLKRRIQRWTVLETIKRSDTWPLYPGMSKSPREKRKVTA